MSEITMTKPNTSSANEIGFLLTDIKRLMRREYLKRELPMTPQQARALMYVSRNQGIRQVALADILEIQPITLARLIDQLAADGLVERQPDPDDRRAYGLYLTAAANERLSDIRHIVKEVQDTAMAGLSAEEIAQFERTLRQMHSNLSGR
jgi:DNA-binding MarR family transcriptional regulator